MLFEKGEMIKKIIVNDKSEQKDSTVQGKLRKVLDETNCKSVSVVYKNTSSTFLYTSKYIVEIKNIDKEHTKEELKQDVTLYIRGIGESMLIADEYFDWNKMKIIYYENN